jgi:hypothetical protein
MINRSCLQCNSLTTFIANNGSRKGKPDWYHKDNGFICSKCYNKNRRLQFRELLLQRVKICHENNPDSVRRAHKKRILFKGKHITLGQNPRSGICSKCNKSIKNGEIKQTHIHHEKYDDSNPLAYTKELCPSCHAKTSWALQQIRNKGEHIVV